MRAGVKQTMMLPQYSGVLCAKNLPLNPGLITACWHAHLCSTSPGIGVWRRAEGYKYLTTRHMCASLQGCTSPAATRTATTGRCSVTRAEGSAGASTCMVKRWWAPESMATPTVVWAEAFGKSLTFHSREVSTGNYCLRSPQSHTSFKCLSVQVLFLNALTCFIILYLTRGSILSSYKSFAETDFYLNVSSSSILSTFADLFLKILFDVLGLN